MPNPFQAIFDAQRAGFHANVTQAREWRLDQLDRMERLLREHKDEFCAALPYAGKDVARSLSPFS